MNGILSVGGGAAFVTQKKTGHKQKHKCPETLSQIKQSEDWVGWPPRVTLGDLARPDPFGALRNPHCAFAV